VDAVVTMARQVGNSERPPARDGAGPRRIRGHAAGVGLPRTASSPMPVSGLNPSPFGRSPTTRTNPDATCPDTSRGHGPRDGLRAQNVMKGVIEHGTGAGRKCSSGRSPGKTGTSADAARRLVRGVHAGVWWPGVWVGYDLKTLPRARGDGRTARPAHVGSPFMREALRGDRAAGFPHTGRGRGRPRGSPQTGLPAQPGARGTINEYFAEGTEPGGTGGARGASGYNSRECASTHHARH